VNTAITAILRPLIRANRIDEAVSIQRRGVRTAEEPPASVFYIAEHLLFLAHRSDLPKGVRLFEKYLRSAVETSDLENRAMFYAAANVLLETLGRCSPRRRKLKLTESLPVHCVDDRYAPLELAQWFGEQVKELAQRFDLRNGNDYFSRRLADIRSFALNH
jgi:hypothetical protein